MSQKREGTRRTGNVRTRGRATQIVKRVFDATIEELSRDGYAAMRVEDVATRSGVNKTTIYRRWPTKAALVAAAIFEQSKQRCPPIDTGTLREDLRTSLLGPFKLKPSEQGFVRVVQMERSIPEVDTLTRRFRDEIRGMRIDMVRRGIARGELPPGVDAELLIDLVSAPVQRALIFNESLDESYIDRLLDVVLTGAVANATCAKTKTNRKRARVGGGKRGKITADKARRSTRSAEWNIPGRT